MICTLTLIATILPVELIVIVAGGYVRQHFPEVFDIYVNMVVIPVATAVTLFAYNIITKNIPHDEEE